MEEQILTELSAQVKKIADHLTFLERKLDTLLEQNKGGRPPFKQGFGGRSDYQGPRSNSFGNRQDKPHFGPRRHDGPPRGNRYEGGPRRHDGPPRGNRSEGSYGPKGPFRHR